MKIKDLFEQKKTIFSLEIFPPKYTAPVESIFETLDGLKGVEPDYISVTYGAGGKAKDRTVEIAEKIKKDYGIESMAHLSCISSTKEEVAAQIQQLKERKARRIFICSTFGLFCDGYEKFDRAYEEGLFDRVFTTNLIYREPELLARPWYTEVSMSKYIAHIINILNHDMSISGLLSPSQRIHQLLERHERELQGKKD